MEIVMPVTFTLNLVNNTGVMLNRAALVGLQGSVAPRISR